MINARSQPCHLAHKTLAELKNFKSKNAEPFNSMYYGTALREKNNNDATAFKEKS